jgi:hypothetical protein
MASGEPFITKYRIESNNYVYCNFGKTMKIKENSRALFQECPPTMMRIILILSTIKRQACQMRFLRQKPVDFVGKGGYDSS